MQVIRILLADDHTILRSGLRMLLEREQGFEVVTEASDGRQTVELALQHKPDVAVVDVAMPRLNGIDAAREISAKNPDIKVIILSMHADEGYVLRALKAGARGYLLKDSPEADLVRAIRSVNEGKAFFSPAVSKILADDYIRNLQQRGLSDPYDLLTPREREVLHLLAEGRSNKEVAGVLELSQYTVETHRSNILQKLNLRGIPELILFAVRKGLVHDIQH
jgi:two-component system response regulator NreC